MAIGRGGGVAMCGVGSRELGVWRIHDDDALGLLPRLKVSLFPPTRPFR
jgi:hypothetical protein